MNMENVIKEFLFSEREKKARVALPGVGTLSTKYWPARDCRMISTGETVTIPAKAVLTFSQALQEDTNKVFLNWAKSHFPSESDIEQQLFKFSEALAHKLKEHGRYRIQEIGEFILKNRPPRYQFDRVKRKFAEKSEHIETVLSVDLSLKMLLASQPTSNTIDFDVLPSFPPKVPDGLSSFSLDRLPKPAELWKLCQILAVLSLCNNDPERHWAVANYRPGFNYACMSNGQGDDCSLLFIGSDACVRGMGHESPMATSKGKPWPGTLDALPGKLRNQIYQDFLEEEPMSFFLWYLEDTQQWNKGAISRFPDVPSDDPDGSECVFSYFPFRAEEYIESESEYYGRNFDLDAIKQIYSYSPLSKKLILKINPECKIPLKIFARTGFPIKKS